jgi:ubiquinone/menaquinone biosynthesis C-methylase UbiE
MSVDAATRTDATRADRRRDVARVYDRIARGYDLVEAPMDLLGGKRRRERVIGRAAGNTLEVGIGTGRNVGLYATGVALTGIDISERMLRRGRMRARQQSRRVRLALADVERLPFPNATFDSVTATCVFCSVPDPVAGLREVARVCKPGGTVLLLEHVRPRNRLLGKVSDRLSPLTRRLFGPEINRRTEDNVVAAGLAVRDVRRRGIWREITAQP